MRLFLPSLVILFLFSGCFPDNQWHIWQTANRSATETVVKENLPLFPFLQKENGEINESFLPGFHLIDIDKDGDQDLVFYTPCHLRITPEIDSTSFYYPGESQGNRYKTYSTGETGMAFWEKKDSTGRVWWYVGMTPSASHGIQEKKTYGESPMYMGWMSSRFLERKD